MGLQNVDLSSWRQFAKPVTTADEDAKAKLTLGNLAQQHVEGDVHIQQMQQELEDARKSSKKSVDVARILSEGGDPQSVHQKLMGIGAIKEADDYLQKKQAEAIAVANATKDQQTEYGGLSLSSTPGGAQQDTATPANQPAAPLYSAPIGGVQEPTKVLPLPQTQYPTSTGNIDITPVSVEERMRREFAKVRGEKGIESANRIAEKSAEQAGNMLEMPIDIPELGIVKGQKVSKDWGDNLMTMAAQLRKPPTSKSLQSKDMVLKNGQRAVLNYNPENGKYSDAAGNDVSGQVAGEYKAPTAAERVTPHTKDEVKWVADQVEKDTTGQVITKYTSGDKPFRDAVLSELMTRGASPETKTAATRTKAETAGPVISQADDLVAFAKDPKNADLFGKIGGRWTELMSGKIGTGDKRMAVLAPKIRSLASLLAPLHGFRSANAAEEFTKTMPLMDSPDAFAAAVNEYKAVAQRVKESGEPSKKADPLGIR